MIKNQQKILVVELSDTRRHVIKNILSRHSFEPISCDDFESALSLLFNTKSQNSYAGIVMSWPEVSTRSADELLSLLVDPDFIFFPTVIITESTNSEICNWTTKRTHSAMVTWDNYSEFVFSLEKLVSSTSENCIKENPFVFDDSTSSIRILFVDDSPTVRVSYRRLLANNGYTIDTANNVDDALKKINATHYDIVITDYYMPEKNGDELCRQIRQNSNAVNTLSAVITGSYLDKVIKDSLDAGAVECMFKDEADVLFLARVKSMSRSIKTQRTMEDEKQWLEGILSSVGDGVYGVDQNGIITFINPTANKILGFQLGDLVGKLAHSCFHFATKEGDTTTPDECILQSAYKNGAVKQAYETVFWHITGHPILVECTVYPLRVNNKLEGSVVAFQDVSQRKILEDELVWQANHDSITKLFNRFYFEKQLAREFEKAKNNRTRSALLYMDLDRFKYLNGTTNHQAGDQFLIEIARLLQTRTRETDLLARIGGDEFAIILRDIGNSNIFYVAESIRNQIQHYKFKYEDKYFQASCSIGISIIEKESMSPADVLANADVACNIAKTKGRNQTHLYVSDANEKTEMNKELGWSRKIRDALQHDEFLVHYQPILKLSDINFDDLPQTDGKIWENILRDTNHQWQHYEVLLRLPGDNGKIVFPGSFLPTAERFNMMPDIDQWVIEYAIDQLSNQKQDVVFAINLSACTIDSQLLPALIKRLIIEYNINPRSLIFEITETTAIANINLASHFINEMNSLGCRFALDDFGSGFSSFSHLRHLNVDYVKIDGQFIRNITENEMDYSIVTAINNISHSLGKKTIAEYVENVDILRLLKKANVDYVQGFYISRPVNTISMINNRLRLPYSEKTKVDP